MQEQGAVVPDVIIFSMVINACGKGGQPKLALTVYGAMLREKVVPNVPTYNTLISVGDRSE